jgi:hypothetical protein
MCSLVLSEISCVVLFPSIVLNVSTVLILLTGHACRGYNAANQINYNLVCFVRKLLSETREEILP